MRNYLMLALFSCFCLMATAQRQKDLHLAFTNANTAFPFSRFGGLFQTPLHPGFELGYGLNWRTRKHHDWYQQFRIGYFYHRFVQHGIPVYTNFGYRYKFNPSFFAESSLGAGYLHSVPATAKLKLGEDGEYHNDKGIGRAQAMVVFNIGTGYVFNPGAQQPISIFINYQQRIQLPFVKSYVPMLPYNSLQLGATMQLLKIKKD